MVATPLPLALMAIAVHDLTGEGPPSGLPPAPIEIELAREHIRGILAIYLVSLLAAVLLSLLMAAIAGALAPAEVKNLLEPIVSPLIALAGTAIGFYFGRPGND
jgi:hypothetical protein